MAGASLNLRQPAPNPRIGVAGGGHGGSSGGGGGGTAGGVREEVHAVAHTHLHFPNAIRAAVWFDAEPC